MKLYKLKHLPTGLFFTPSKGSGNLSATGKIYIDRIPDISWTEIVRVVLYPEKKSKKNQKIIEYFRIDTAKWKIDENFKTDPKDWEIVELP